MGLKESSGIYVGEVIKGGAADKAGIREKDVIQKINGYEVLTVPQLTEQLGQYTPGNTIQVTLSRNGQEKVFDVILQNTFGDVSVDTDSGILGAQVVPLTEEDRYRYRVDKGVKIQELKNGKLKSAGLSAGYVIVKINNTVIYNREDLERAVKSAGSDGVFVTAVSPRGRVEYFAFSLLN